MEMFKVMSAICLQMIHLCSVRMQESLASQLETFSLVVSLAWAVYNTIPPLLLLHYAVLDTRGLRASMSVCSIIGSIVLLAIIVAVWVLLPPSYHFGEVSTTQFARSIIATLARPIQLNIGSSTLFDRP